MAFLVRDFQKTENLAAFALRLFSLGHIYGDYDSRLSSLDEIVSLGFCRET
jgi:hypothetical protein